MVGPNEKHLNIIEYMSDLGSFTITFPKFTLSKKAYGIMTKYCRMKYLHTIPISDISQYEIGAKCK